MDRIAARSESCTPRHPHRPFPHFREYRISLFMAPSSQESEPPGKPGRFSNCPAHTVVTVKVTATFRRLSRVRMELHRT